MGAIYFAWLGAALAIYWLTFGGAVPASIGEFARDVLTTPAGWALIIIGCSVGLLRPGGPGHQCRVLSAASRPRRFGHDGDPHLGARVPRQPGHHGDVDIIVAGLLVIGTVPFFVGLAVVMPVLGHATWHLYRRVVER